MSRGLSTSPCDVSGMDATRVPCRRWCGTLAVCGGIGAIICRGDDLEDLGLAVDAETGGSGDEVDAGVRCGHRLLRHYRAVLGYLLHSERAGKFTGKQV